ncbi:MAG: hypothetical protein H6719_23585 [Sandaracinaceae bacterium]|nr:hypothetical protein [Sandaracinaceae bacterium]
MNLNESTRATDRRPLGPEHLDDLARLSVAELGALYRDAPAPTSLEDLAGAPVGRMLTVRGIDRPRRRAGVAQLARAGFFPWRGKSFEAFDHERGEGINRTTLLGERFKFGLSFDRSAIDGGPCVLLDYDRSDNPWPIRQIRDELRELRPGLFLGPALWKTKRDPVLVLWFAIDNR